MSQNLAVTPKAELPQRYESAKIALAECVEVDECAEWANKALALASYALQSKDESLYKMAVRIRARAIRRTGEILKEIEPATGAHLKSNAGDTLSRKDAATKAGLSKRQQVTAIRIANVPKIDFERVVESNKPIGIRALAELGKVSKPRLVDKRDPELFSVSTQGQAGIASLYNVSKSTDPKQVALGATAKERARLETHSKQLIVWLNQLVRQIRRMRA